MSVHMKEGSLHIETTDEAHTSSVKAPPKTKEESTTCRPWKVPCETASKQELQAYITKTPSAFNRRFFRRGCTICGQSQKDPVHIPCGHVFCRQCILLHLETQSATGEYTCPNCRRRYLTRPTLQEKEPSSSDDDGKLSANPVLNTPHKSPQGQLKRQKLGEDCTTSHSNKQSGEIVSEKEDDGFLKFHKASLKRRIEQCGESITKAASQNNHRIITKYAADTNLFSLFEETEEKFTSVSCNDIFKASGVIRTVMTQGAAGIGKTSSVHKFILDWADGKENKDVDFVFMFPFWRLNLVKDISCSLHKLLLNFNLEFDNLAAIKRFDDSRIVVIFDGLDESQLHLDFQSNPMLCDILEISSVDTLITNIIKGNLLPFAKVWITSRGSSTNQVPSWYINRVTEILPLSDSQMEECVKNSLNDVTDASSILHQIKLSRSLHAMCHIPALCSIAVSVVKNMLEQGETRMIQTCTELYSHFFISQMNTEAEAKSSSVQDEGEKMVDEKPQRTKMEMMLRFSELALRQLMKSSFTFFEQDLRDCEIDISETASIFRIFTEINQDKSEFFQENVFRFKHMGIQEFLAAFCVFYAYNNKNMDVLKHLLEGKFSIQPEDVSLDTLLRSAVNKMLERKNGHQYFLRFLHGMSLESSQMLLQSVLTDTCDSSGTTESTLKYIKDLGKQADVSMDRCIDLLHCQIEMRDPSVIEDIESLLRSQREFSLSHWSEISILIQMSGGILGEFNLQKCHPSERKTVLSMFMSCCRKAQVSNCFLYEDLCVIVASALQHPHSALRELDMSGNPLRVAGVKQLCSALKSPNCKLEILRVSNCFLYEDSCVIVASALQHPHSALRELDMSGNPLSDSGVKQLVSALKSLNCKLEILRISNCDLSADSCVMVASALQQPHSALRELDMSGNNLGTSGVEQLCSGLKSPNCKLEILRISNCFLDEDSCVIVASALQNPHCALRELDMSGNHLRDSGVKKLCSGLKSPNCKLQILRLSNCDLSADSFVMVASALQKPHSALRELDMSGNLLWDLGVKQLCSGLKSPKCKLEILRVSNCGLSADSFVMVASALQQPHNALRELDMSGNILWDSGVEQLCSGLKSPNCKLEILRLSQCKLRNTSCLNLISALGSDHSRLRELDVSNNFLEESEVKLLTKRVEDPKCKLEVLKSEPTQESHPSSLEHIFALTILHPTTIAHLLRNHPEVSLSSEEESECLEPQESDGPFKLQTNDYEDGGGGDDDNNDEDDGKSSAETECSGGVSAEKEFENISDSCAVPEVFTPECCPYNERRSYRFTCSSEGLFQCWYTGLVFKMETAGEVQYRTEPWNCVQLVDGYVPAGPLFNIKCPQGTLSQLHFPHCELFSGKGCLSVIHISDSEKSEMLDPHEITDIHVVLNISGCSEYGLIKKEYTPIHGLVLLFLQQSTLNVLLLPKNVDISEVTEKRRERIEPEKEKYVETTSNCVLVPEEKYCLTCDPKHVIDPDTATFVDYDYNKNYIPTFQVELCECVKVMMVLKENDKEEPVWQRTVKLAALQTERNQRDLPDSNPSSSYTPLGQKFLQKHKADLERRLTILGNLLTQLEKRKALTGEERELLNSKPTRQEKNHVLLTMLQNRGGKAQEIFYQTLKKLDPLLVEDLEKPNESEAESESELTEQVQ
ncbi:NACHT, LRR and PYD domains-containing protein 14-like [Alosa sapidissima]|uniref:NACHT, LRR and PYD domains-containing protein 14-like n=1 Tax=Alosa sapidissima TaxID=34773 RepID=UPI001C094235|nr:NACHT, LRR and PYD domains-containing protein 14-like [Alosa sapidissima]